MTFPKPALKVTKPRAETRGNDVVQEAIRPFAIAEKLRTLRLRKSMGLVQLSQHTGLSPAMISKLENARLVPTIPTLVRIATVFNVGLDYFFTDERKRYTVAVARKGERLRFPERSDAKPGSYQFESLNFRAIDRKLHGFLAEFDGVPAEAAAPHHHPGVELLYVQEGTLEMKIGTETYMLEAGDAIYFDSIQKHSYRRVGEVKCTALVVTTAG